MSLIFFLWSFYLCTVMIRLSGHICSQSIFRDKQVFRITESHIYLVRTLKSVPTPFFQTSEISGLSEPGLGIITVEVFVIGLGQISSIFSWNRKLSMLPGKSSRKSCAGVWSDSRSRSHGVKQHPTATTSSKGVKVTSAYSKRVIRVCPTRFFNSLIMAKSLKIIWNGFINRKRMAAF